jgi:hypothetical protein
MMTRQRCVFAYPCLSSQCQHAEDPHFGGKIIEILSDWDEGDYMGDRLSRTWSWEGGPAVLCKPEPELHREVGPGTPAGMSSQ